jgi:hypothetical protein
VLFRSPQNPKTPNGKKRVSGIIILLNMNFSKYSTSNLAASGNLNHSMNYTQGSSQLKRQGSSTTATQNPANVANRQEQSVERLNSCIADLKRLASSKAKRQGNGST